MISTALAIDGGRTYSVASQVGLALDASALAGAKLLNGTATDEDVRTAAVSTLDANLSRLGIGNVSFQNPVVSIDRPNSAVTVSSQVSVSTMLGGLAGVPSITFTKSATTIYDLAQLEVVMALDITGSMNQIPAGDTVSKLTTLKSVASSVISSLYAEATTDKNIRIGIVPWSNSVNVGNYVTQVASTPPPQQQYEWWQQQPQTDCIQERSGGADVTDVAPAALNYATVMPVGSACPTNAIVPMVGKSQASTLISLIDGLTATSGTAGHIGTAWAWYLISPNWASIWPSDSTPDNYGTRTVKNVIILTDGIFNTDYVGGTTTTVNGTLYDNTSYTLFQQNCQGMRNAGINVYTIALDLTDATAVQNLQQCAPSGNYFSANNAAQLNAAFAAIIKKLTQIRITK